MSMSFNAGNQNITGSVTATTTLQKNTVLCKNGTRGTAGTTTLGTVGAGKVWRIIAMDLSSYSGASGPINSIQLNSVKVLSHTCAGTATASLFGHSTFTGSYENALLLTAGQNLDLVQESANGAVHASVFYVEETT